MSKTLKGHGGRAEDVIQFIECVVVMHESLGSVPRNS